jgi:hypothetical protein
MKMNPEIKGEGIPGRQNQTTIGRGKIRLTI